MFIVLLLDLLINLVLFSARPDLFLKNKPDPVEVTPRVVSLWSPIGTPYQPLPPTPSLHAPTSINALSTPFPEPSTNFFGIDFRPGAARIKILVRPQTDRLNDGKPITIEVNPGSSCHYQDHHACVSAFRQGRSGNVIFISVHSGIGGEAEVYRRAIEGMGLDQAGFSIKLICSNLARLENASVQIRQGDRIVVGLKLAAAMRVPPGLLQDYFNGSVEQAMALAASVNPNLGDFPDPDSPAVSF